MKHETVQQCGVRLGAEFANVWADHRIEFLEAEIRSLRQTIRSLATSVIEGDRGSTNSLAWAVLDLLRTKEQEL